MIVQLDNDTAVNPYWVWHIRRTKNAGECNIRVGNGKWVSDIIVNLSIDEVVNKLNKEQ